MNKSIVTGWYVLAVAALLGSVLTIVIACSPSVSQQTITNEKTQQDIGVAAIQRNQPVPDLGGYSFQRQMVISFYIAQNQVVSTWTYWPLDYTGQLVEICQSRGYPIPGGAQLTNPQRVDDNYSTRPVVGNPEPNSLYPPAVAAGTIVMCLNPDGSLSPQYWENNVFASPYRLKADKVLQRADGADGQASYSVKPGK